MSSFNNVKQELSRISDLYTDVKFANNNELDKAANDIDVAFNTYKNELEILKNKLHDSIYSNVESFINEGDNIWSEQYAKMSFEEHLEWSKNWPPSKEDYNYFVTSISSHANWQQPAIVAGSGQSDVLKALMGSEPLYSIEQYPEYHQLQRDRFSPEYQRRLRCYQYTEINLLPKNAAGIIVVYNQFQFMPWKKVEKIIANLINVLSPGGVLYFTYNNCNYPKSFKFFEDGSMTYSLPELYYQSCQDLTLDIDYTSPYEDFSFMKFVKPGSVKLIKRYPSFGVIDQQPTLKTPNVHEPRIKKIKQVFKS